MRAFVVDRYGTDGLRRAEVPMPVAGDRDIVVEVRAASINPLDRMIRDGEFKFLLRHARPFVLGHDVAGVVTATGSSVRRFAVGDEVYARPRDERIGTFAEYLAIDEDDAARKPAALSFQEAAAVPLVALASWQALAELGQVQPGQRVLVHGGAGGLGSTAIQVAKHLGAHVATTASADDADKVRSLGADEVIDHRSTDFTEVLADYDVVLDSVGGDNLDRSLTVLRRGGLAISVVGPPDPHFATQLGLPLLRPVMWLMSREVRRRAAKLGVRYAFFFMRADGSRLEDLRELYEDGTLRPVLDRTFPFDSTVEAMSYVEQGRAHGKVVIDHTGS